MRTNFAKRLSNRPATAGDEPETVTKMPPRRAVLVASAGLVAAPLLGWSPASAHGGHTQSAGTRSGRGRIRQGHQGLRTLYVASDESLTLDATAEYDLLVIEDGGTIAVADGYALTLTVNGV
ncbi:MAG: hypothetical protein QM655_16675, partial [Nocardioidaceae bacterium]